MTIKRASAAALIILLSFGVNAQNCTGLMQISANTPKATSELVTSFFSKNPPCASAKMIVDMILNPDKRIGGRKLEGDKPFNMREAQANLDAALKIPEVNAKITRARQEIADENVRLAYEAAVLDDEGFYGARELKLQQLMQRIR